MRPNGRRGFGRKAGFRAIGGGSSAPTPATIFGASLKQWLDERGQSGASWVDQSGNGNTLSQASGTLQPTAGTAINGQPTLRWDGVDDVMTGPAISGLISSLRFGVWLVMRTKTVPVMGPTVYTDPQVFGDANGVLGLSCTTTPRLWCFDGGYKYSSATATFASDTLYAVHGYKGAAGLVLDVSGQSATSPMAAATINPLAGAFWQGRTFGSGYGNFELAFQVFIDREPTSGEQAQMSAYLLSKYGVQP